jgi:hypothetical protein
MCFNYKVSLLTFGLGLVFSYLLFKYGNKKYELENKITAILFIFISLIQLMDFLFWIDINNNYGINKITTILGPFINMCQPVILYLIKYYYYKPNVFTFENCNFPIFVLNILYMSIYHLIILNFFLNIIKLKINY